MTHREEDLTERLVAGLRAIDGVETFSIFGEDHDRAPVVSFVIDGLEPGLVSAALSAEHAIAVRDGKFCAHLLVDALLEDAGVEARSAVLANTDEHIERLLAAVESLATRGPRAAYHVVEGEGWVPVDDPRDLSVTLPW